MRLVCFSHDRKTRVGVASGDKIVEITADGQPPTVADTLNNENLGSLRTALKTGERTYRADDVQFEPMIAPAARVFCIGINYLKKHPIAGIISAAPEQPTIFPKLRECFVGHKRRIERPKGISEQLDYEGELAVVIGRGGRNIGRGEAYGHVFGYTILNDGSVRDWQKHSLFSGKNFFHASSIGPAVVTADEIANPMNLALSTRINGIEVQNVNTGAMLFDIPTAISHISRFMPLKPGDIIATGSPSGSGASLDPPRFLQPGDEIEIEIEGLGVLSNKVL